MSKASEAKLAELHGALAEVLTKQLDMPIVTKDGVIVQDTEGLGVSAAVLSVAVAFLKNNNISADAAGNTGLNDLAAKLAAKREEAKRNLRKPLDFNQAVEDFEKSAGFGGVQ